MAFDHLAPILDAAVALDRRHHEAAAEPHQGDHQRHQRRLPRRERRDPPQRRAEQRWRWRRRRQSPRPSSRATGCGAIGRRPRSLPQTYCSTSLDCTTSTRNAISSSLRPSNPGIGKVSSAGTCDRQKTADHQAPLHLGDAPHEVGRVAAQRRDDRQQQEDVDRDEDRVEPVPLDPDQIVLHRQHDEEGRRQAPSDRRAGSGQGEELAQAPRTRRRRRAAITPALPKAKASADQHHHHPPRLDPGVEVVDRRSGSAPA